MFPLSNPSIITAQNKNPLPLVTPSNNSPRRRPSVARLCSHSPSFYFRGLSSCLLNTKIQLFVNPSPHVILQTCYRNSIRPKQKLPCQSAFYSLGVRLDHHPHNRHVESTIIAIRSLGTPHIVDLQVHLPQASKTRHTLCTAYSLQFTKDQYLVFSTVYLLGIPRWSAWSHLGQRCHALTTLDYKLLQSSSST